jgi:hypothetical protein
VGPSVSQSGRLLEPLPPTRTLVQVSGLLAVPEHSPTLAPRSFVNNRWTLWGLAVRWRRSTGIPGTTGTPSRIEDFPAKESLHPSRFSIHLPFYDFTPSALFCYSSDSYFALPVGVMGASLSTKNGRAMPGKFQKRWSGDIDFSVPVGDY